MPKIKQVTLSIDGVEITARDNTRILWAALDNGIYIPNLRAIRGTMEPYAACRLCQVEIKGRSGLVTACTEPVSDGLVVSTNTDRAMRVRRTALELILSNHPIVCSECSKNARCALQDVAQRLNVSLRQKRFPNIPRHYNVDGSHPAMTYDPNLCILCGKCVWVCNEYGKGTLNFAFRGMKTVVSAFGGLPLKETGCDSCARCVAVCPTGALIPKVPGKGRIRKKKASESPLA